MVKNFGTGSHITIDDLLADVPPVVDADGKRIEEGDTLYTCKGKALEVGTINDHGSVSVVDKNGEFGFLGNWQCGTLTHTPPTRSAWGKQIKVGDYVRLVGTTDSMKVTAIGKDNMIRCEDPFELLSEGIYYAGEELEHAPSPFEVRNTHGINYVPKDAGGELTLIGYEMPADYIDVTADGKRARFAKLGEFKDDDAFWITDELWDESLDELAKLV